MCQPLRELGGGVDDLHCCVTHNQGVFKNQETADHSSQSITSSADMQMQMNNWTAAEIREMLASPQSL